MADNYFNLIQLIFGKRWLDAFSSSLKSLPFSHHSFHSLFIQIETLINCLCLHTFQWFIQLINNYKCVCFHCIGVKGIDLLLLWKMSHLHAIHLPLHSWRTNWIFIDLATICIYVIRLRDLQNHLVIVNVHFRDDFFCYWHSLNKRAAQIRNTPLTWSSFIVEFMTHWTNLNY